MTIVMTILTLWWTMTMYSLLILGLMWLTKELMMGICFSKKKLRDKVILVTGGTAGIGKQTALDLAKRRAIVILTGRTKQKTEETVRWIQKESKNENVEGICLDLSSQKDVRRFAKSIKEKYPKIHYIINNAGMVGDVSARFQSNVDKESFRKVSEDGYEMIMATNYFGPVTLTELLLGNLKFAAQDSPEPCRVIFVSSLGYLYGTLQSGLDLNMEKCPYNGNIQYCNSKQALVLYSKELARKVKKFNMESVSLHPGIVRTDIFRNTTDWGQKMMMAIFCLLGKNSWQGAQTSIYAVVSKEQLNGKFLQDCRSNFLGKSKTTSNKGLEKELFKSTRSLLKLI